MPIKFPKGFQRRKSSGSALEEVPNPPQPSFRVFERNPDGSKSFDGADKLKRLSEVRPLSEGQALEYQAGPGRPSLNVNPNNRGSGGTQTSASSAGLCDTSSSSACYSSSSTLPSSSSLEAAQDDSSHAHPAYSRGGPTPSAPTTPAPSGFKLRNAARTFSFGARKSMFTPQPPTHPSPAPVSIAQHHAEFTDIPDVQQPTRSRAMTEMSYTSASTATPPKLLDTGLDLSFSEESDGFGSMFDNLDKDGRKKSRNMDNWQTPTQSNRGSTGLGLSESSHNSTMKPLPPLQLDRTKAVTPSPYSAKSHDSRDGLMSSSPQLEEEGYEYDGGRSRGNRTTYSALRSESTGNSPNLSGPAAHVQGQHQAARSYGNRGSEPISDDDARLVMRYLNSGDNGSPALGPPSSLPIHRKPLAQHPLPRPPSRTPVTLYDGPNQDHLMNESSQTESIGSTPKATNASFELYEEGPDEAFQGMARSAARYEPGRASPARPPPPAKGKVMTPAQFESYRKEKELSRSRSDASKSEDSDDGSDDAYDEEDEAERNRQMAKQRQKQDAQMSVYRQQMMKVTGEQQPLGQRPGMDPQSQSAPALGARISTFNLSDKAGEGSKSSEDEDEDIPLGILAAHGFPSKERPPSHLSRTGSQPNIHYTSETYPAPPAPPSVAGGASTKGLPVFARNLPKDPYYGASIVNPTNRESLAFGSGSASVYGGSQAGVPPGMPPGGLVGVIAKEERARALRRGSPNAQSFEVSNAAGGLPLPPGMMPGMPPVASADQQAQLHMSQQMTQMMQMQMQWMQQMMQMQGMPGMLSMQQTPQTPQMPGQMQSPHPLPPTPGQLSPNPASFAGPRPNSMGSNSARPNPLPQQGRAMSMLSPGSGAQWSSGRSTRASVSPSLGLRGSHTFAPGPQQQQGYAPSIAPSERSNVGHPSRYRPVSTVPSEGAVGGERASTMGSQTLLAWEGGKSGAVANDGTGKAAATMRIVERKTEDEEEDEGWEEMKKKKEGKKRLWRSKKKDGEGNGLEGVFYPEDA